MTPLDPQRSSCDDGRISSRALLLTAALAAFLCAATPAAADRAETRVVKVLAWETQSKVTERPPAGIPGDVFTGADRLRNAVPQFGKPKGAVIGRDRYRVAPDSATSASIDVTTTLPGGTIRCRGRAKLSLKIVIPLVGGTGAYEGASGTCAAEGGSRSACRHPGERRRDCDLNTYRIRT